jgi:folate-binding protein YgfZ
VEDVAAIRNGAGFWVLGDVGVLCARGKDRISWANGMVTCDVLAIPDGGSHAAGIVTPKGKFVALVDVWRDPEAVWMLVEGGRASEARRVLDGYLVMEEVELQDRGLDFAVVTVQGARAREAVDVVGCPFRSKDRSGAGGFDVLAPRDRLANVVHDLGLRAVPASAAAAETLRVELGLRAWGREVTEDVFPQEARLEDSIVSFTKGCYVGQETVVRLRDRGHANRFVVGLDLGETPVPEAGAEVRAGDAVVGSITSAVRSPTLGRSIAMAMVKRAHVEPGTVLSVGGAPARVATLPFVR